MNMGNTSSMTYKTLPNAILTFGPASQSPTNLEKTRSLLSELNRTIGVVNRISNDWSHRFQVAVTIGSVTGPVTTIMSIVLLLIEETNKLQLEIGKSEIRIQNIDIEGSLAVLRNIVVILQHPQTSSTQLLNEIGYAMHEFHKLLPKFTRKESVLYIKYYLGAPLFVQICGLFKIVVLIASSIPEYINPQLRNIVDDYQGTLDSFRIRCIRERCRSIYMYSYYGTNTNWEGQFSHPRSYFYDTLTQFPNYFDGTECTIINLVRYGLRESSEQEQLNHSKTKWFDYPNFDGMYDEWDDRERNHVAFEDVDLHRDEIGADEFHPRSLYRKAITIYRRKVINLMEEFFEEANLPETLCQKNELRLIQGRC